MIQVVGIGAGGHAKILVELLIETGGYDLVGFTDPDQTRWGGSLMGYPILGGDGELPALRAKGVQAAFIGVGAVSSAGTRLRARLFREALALGFEMPILLHPHAAISPSATVGPGSVVMAGAVVSSAVRIGANVTVYSGVIIEHDSVICDHVHLSPGVHLAGGVMIEDEAFVGIGASIIQGIRIGARAVVGAGAAVIRDVPAGSTAVGVPARTLPVPAK